MVWFFLFTEVHISTIYTVVFACSGGITLLCRVITGARSTTWACFARGFGVTKALALEALDGACVLLRVLRGPDFAFIDDIVKDGSVCCIWVAESDENGGEGFLLRYGIGVGPANGLK